MIDSTTIDEAVDLLDCAGWKGYAQAVREQARQVANLPDLLAALRHTHSEFCSVRCPSTFKSSEEPRHCPDCDTIRAIIVKAEGF